MADKTEYTDPSHLDDNKRQISEIVKNIRHKMYGVDVRESIAEGIETCYEDAISEGNANMEVSQARGGYTSLGAREDAQDEKSEKLQSQVDDLVLQAGNPDPSSAEIVQARGGENVLNTRLDGIEDGSRIEYRWEAKINKFDNVSGEDGILLGNNNQVSVNANYYTTVYPVKIKPNTTYIGESFGKTVFLTFFDSSMKYTHTELLNETYQGVIYGNKVTTRSNDKYIRFSLLLANKSRAFFRELALGAEGQIKYSSFVWQYNGYSIGEKSFFKRADIASGKINAQVNLDKTITVRFIKDAGDGSFIIVTEDGFINADNNPDELKIKNLDMLIFDKKSQKISNMSFDDLLIADRKQTYLLGGFWGVRFLFSSYETLTHVKSISASDSIFYLGETFPRTSEKVIRVGKNRECQFDKIQDACDFAVNGTTILIYPGMYEESIDIRDKSLYLVGFDKEKTIVQSTNDHRDYPPLEMCNGGCRNLTFYAKRLSGAEIPDYYTPYAAHIDYDQQANGSLYIDNCIFKSDWNAAVGIGMRKGYILEFKNCEFISNRGNIGAFFFHDSSKQEGAGTYYLKVDNCNIKSIGNYGMSCQAIGYEGNDLQLTLYRNMIWSATNKATDSTIQASQPSSPYPPSTGNKFLGTGTITLTDDSFGNNVNICNA